MDNTVKIIEKTEVPCKATIIDARVEVKSTSTTRVHVTRILLRRFSQHTNNKHELRKLTLPAIHVSTYRLPFNSHNEISTCRLEDTHKKVL